MKLQPYLDFWVSEVEMDFSCPACVLLWCLSVPCVSLPHRSFFLLPKQPEQAAKPFVLSFSYPFFPKWPFLPSVPLCHVFHILECQCATCWHCAWMITCLYIVIENRIPFPWCWQNNGLNVVQIQVFCSSFTLFSYIFFFYVRRAYKNSMFLI